MRKRWASYLAALALSLGTSAAWGQAPPPPPGPLPAPAPLVEVHKGDAQAVAPAPGIQAAPVPSVVVPAPAVILPGNGGGCDSGCGGPRCSWSITGGLYYLKPVWSSNPNSAFTTTSVGATGTTTSVQNFDHGFDLGYSAAIGATFGNGVGVRFGWFNFSSDQTVGTGATGVATGIAVGDSALTALPIGGSALATNNLELSIYDFELTYLWNISAGWTTTAAAGIRYVDLHQDYSLTTSDAAGVALDGVTATNRFRGAGPTLALESHKKCGCGPFGIYGIARGSVVFGDRDQTATYTVAGVTTLASQSSQDVIGIGELELGVEANCALGCRCRFFGQLGFVGQAWLGAGNSTPISLLGSTSASSSNMGLYGGVLRLGVAF